MKTKNTGMKRFIKRVISMMLAVITIAGLLTSGLSQPAEAASSGTTWKSLRSGNVVKLWKWSTAGLYNSFSEVPSNTTRMLLVWRSPKNDDYPNQDNNGTTTYWTGNCSFTTNNMPGAATVYNRASDGGSWYEDSDFNDYSGIKGEKCDSIYFEKYLKTFISSSDFGTFKTEIKLSPENSDEKKYTDKFIKNFRILIGGKEVIAENDSDAFTYPGGWEDNMICGYQLSEYTFRFAYHRGFTSSSYRWKTSDYSLIGQADADYDTNLTSTYDHSIFFTYENYIGCFGSHNYIWKNMGSFSQTYDDIHKSGKQFRVYFGSETTYGVTENLVVKQGQVYNVKGNQFLTGTIIVEPGGVLSFDEGDSFLDCNIENYGTVILQKGARVYPYLPDTSDNNGAITCYGSNTVYHAKTGTTSEAEGQPGEGAMIVMEGAYYSQKANYGGLTLYEGAVLENYGTMLLTRYLVAIHAQVHNYSSGKMYYGSYCSQILDANIDYVDESQFSSATGYYSRILQDEDSYYINEGTVKNEVGIKVADIIEEYNATEIETSANNRTKYITDEMAKYDKEHEATLPVAGVDWVDRDIAYTYDKLVASVNRTQWRLSYYNKLWEAVTPTYESQYTAGMSYANVSDSGLQWYIILCETRDTLLKRYAYLSSVLSKYEDERSKKYAQVYRDALKKYPIYTGRLDELKIQQSEIEEYRDGLIESTTLSREAWLAKQGYGQYMTETEIDTAYNKYVLSVIQDVKKKYPDVDSSSASEASETTEQVAQCKVEMNKNPVKDPTSYRQSTISDIKNSSISYKGYTWQSMGYDYSLDWDENRYIDIFDSQAHARYTYSSGTQWKYSWDYLKIMDPTVRNNFYGAAQSAANAEASEYENTIFNDVEAFAENYNEYVVSYCTSLKVKYPLASSYIDSWYKENYETASTETAEQLQTEREAYATEKMSSAYSNYTFKWNDDGKTLWNNLLKQYGSKIEWENAYEAVNYAFAEFVVQNMGDKSREELKTLAATSKRYEMMYLYYNTCLTQCTEYYEKYKSTYSGLSDREKQRLLTFLDNVLNWTQKGTGNRQTMNRIIPFLQLYVDSVVQYPGSDLTLYTQMPTLRKQFYDARYSSLVNGLTALSKTIQTKNDLGSTALSAQIVSRIKQLAKQQAETESLQYYPETFSTSYKLPADTPQELVDSLDIPKELKTALGVK